MYIKKITLIFFISLITFSCKDSGLKERTGSLRVSELIELFKPTNENYPKISVHRGGKGLLHYPENCLETIMYVSDSIPAIFEIDVAQTKDGQLILMHDNSINRTTNGEGLVTNLTYKELKDYVLVDDFGNKTPFKIPLLAEVLEWCKTQGIIVTVDIKRSVKQSTVLDVIRKAKAEDFCILITYDVEQAVSAYNMAPELLLSVSARNKNEFERLLETNIPTANMLAFTGTRLSDASLYKALHEKGILCMLGSLGNLDGQAQARGNYLYNTWLDLGIDILATDRPFDAFSAINK